MNFNSFMYVKSFKSDSLTFICFNLPCQLHALLNARQHTGNSNSQAVLNFTDFPSESLIQLPLLGNGNQVHEIHALACADYKINMFLTLGFGCAVSAWTH